MEERNRGRYEIAGRKTIAEGQDLRVRQLTLTGGQAVPWHYHSAITDSFVGLKGATVVETRTPAGKTVLLPGEQCAVPPGQAHKVYGQDGEGCSFLIIQGVGVYDFIAAD